MCSPKKFKTIKKWTVTCDVYESIYVEWQYKQPVVQPKILQGIDQVGYVAP